MSTIPASQIVSVVPSVLSAGGTGLQGIGLMLDSSNRIPLGTVASFNSAQAVTSYFGAASKQSAEALIYFAGFNGATVLPSSLLMAQFNPAGASAYLRGGSTIAMTLAQLQSISGSLNLTIDGYAHNAATLNLSTATSFSNAASLIQTAINASLASSAVGTGSIAPATFSVTGSISGNVMTVTAVLSGTIVNGAGISGAGVQGGTTVSNQLSGTTGGVGTYAVNNSQTVAATNISGSYGTMTITAMTSGAFAVGLTITGTGTTAGTVITQLGTGIGQTGTYFVNLSQTAAGPTMTGTTTPATVTFDSVSSAFVIASGITGAASSIAYATGTTAASLFLTAATGAVISQGGAAQTPQSFMTNLITQNSAWVNFMTIFDPDGGAGNQQKQAFSLWKNTALGGNRFAYFCWDPDATPAASNNATTSLGQILAHNNDSGTVLIWEGGSTQDTGLCAFALGWAASINYNQINGRTVLAFRNQAGLTANVTDPVTSGNLIANNYNFYGAYGAATASFIWEQIGEITGPFAWADSFETQVWMNSYFQNQLLQLFANSLSVPFTPTGVGLIQQSCQTVIQQGLAFGAFAPNTLTPGQIAQVNAVAGANIAGTLQTQGYYLQVNIPNQTIQVARGPWSITFFYIDRNSVQSISLASIMVP